MPASATSDSTSSLSTRTFVSSRIPFFFKNISHQRYLRFYNIYLLLARGRRIQNSLLSSTIDTRLTDTISPAFFILLLPFSILIPFLRPLTMARSQPDGPMWGPLTLVKFSYVTYPSNSICSTWNHLTSNNLKLVIQTLRVVDDHGTYDQRLMMRVSKGPEILVILYPRPARSLANSVFSRYRRILIVYLGFVNVMRQWLKGHRTVRVLLCGILRARES